MDTYIVNGDFDVDVQGYPRAVYGTSELCQRAAIIFSLKKGLFRYDRELGVDWDFSEIPIGSSEALLMRLREACADRDDIVVSNASVETDGQNKRLSFELDCGDMNYTEVNVRERV